MCRWTLNYHAHTRSFAITATHRLMVQKGKTFIEREKKNTRTKNVGRKCNVNEEYKKVCVLVAKMENKYKNGIPNVILDDAHLNCASISFMVTSFMATKSFGTTMST